MWSRPRLVKPPAASLTPSSRRWSRPWLDASIAAWVTPASASSRQQPVQRDRIGRRQRAVFVAAGRDDAGRADAGGRDAGLLPDLAGEGGDRGLAAGAGHGDHRRRAGADRSARRSAPAPAAGRRPRSPARRGRPSAAPLARRRRPRRRVAAASAAKAAPSALVPATRDEQDARLDCRANPDETPVTRRCCASVGRRQAECRQSP